ncbi:hypothetical protein CNMCM7691_008176 [Aspergillus felis]|uniref:Uncharacterized protein n=1 Tax=Aspergillus felis TaxID=1287682 RepID=A0A8H6QU06_9EURO|nr:hypothetical protein CNMCM7691_008176 [Aspergillus felis]
MILSSDEDDHEHGDSGGPGNSGSSPEDGHGSSGRTGTGADSGGGGSRNADDYGSCSCDSSANLGASSPWRNPTPEQRDAARQLLVQVQTDAQDTAVQELSQSDPDRAKRLRYLLDMSRGAVTIPTPTTPPPSQPNKNLLGSRETSPLSSAVSTISSPPSPSGGPPSLASPPLAGTPPRDATAGQSSQKTRKRKLGHDTDFDIDFYAYDIRNNVVEWAQDANVLPVIMAEAAPRVGHMGVTGNQLPEPGAVGSGMWWAHAHQNPPSDSSSFLSVEDSFTTGIITSYPIVASAKDAMTH